MDLVSEELVCHAYDWQLEDNSTENGNLSIHAWCLNRNDESMLLRIEEFPAMCHIELPEFVGTRHGDWNNSKAKVFYKYLCKMLEREHHEPLSYDLVWKEKLYYYSSGKKYPMLWVTFKTMEAMRHCNNLLKEPISVLGIGGRNNPPKAKYNMWQNQVPTTRKLLTFRDCGYAQWFRIQGIKVPAEQKISHMENEYIVSWNTLTAIGPTESKGWITHPKTLSFDIETFSDNYKALPIKYNPKHVSFMISSTTERLGLPETKVKQTYVLGDCGDVPENEVIRVHDEIEMIEIFAQLVRDYDPDLMTGYNIFGYDYDYLHHRVITKGRQWPDYMSRLMTKKPFYKPSAWASSAYGNLSINQLMMPGRISVDVYLMIKRDHKLPQYKLNTVAKHFLDKEKHDVTPVEMFIAHAELSEAILLYERCVKEWVPDDPDVVGLTSREIQNKYDGYERAGSSGSSGSTESRFDIRSEVTNASGRLKCLDNGENLLRLSKIDPDTVGLADLPPISSSYGMRAIYHENIDPKVILSVIIKYEECKKEMTRVGAYCDQDAVLAIEILEKVNGWVALVEMSTIVGVPVQDIYTRGQQIRGLSLIYDMVARMNIVIDSKEFNFGKWSGGFVWEPNPGLYDNVICLDFKSLYPSIIIAYNICYTTLIPKEMEDSIPDEMCNILEWDDDGDGSGNTDDMAEDTGDDDDDDDDDDEDEDENEDVEGEGKTKKPKREAKHYRFKFLREEHRKGVLPQLVQRLIDTRNDVREEQKTETDKVYWGVLEQRQLGYKVCANSMYGMLGVSRNGVLPLLPAAMSVTAEGRRLITFCNDYIVEKYGGNVVYNDTDSTMVQLPPELVSNGLQAIEWGRKLEEEMSALFASHGRKALYLEFEKAGRMLCIRKKKYAYWLLDLREKLEIKNPDGSSQKVSNPGFGQLRDIKTDKGAVMKKGIILARRDNCLWQRKFYELILYKIMVRSPKEEVLSIIVKNVMEMYLGKVPWQMLTIIKGLGANYKSPSYFMKVFSDELQRIGLPASPGDRLEYVIVKTREELEAEEEARKATDEGKKIGKKKILLGYKMRLPETYIDRIVSDKPEPIDSMYYLEKVATNCIEQLWQVAYRPELAAIEKQNKVDDATNILTQLKEWGYGMYVDAYLSHTRYDAETAVKLLLDNPNLDKITVEARKIHVTGHHIFDTRLSRKPIQTMTKAIAVGKLDLVLNSFCQDPDERDGWIGKLHAKKTGRTVISCP
jgi:DNA polymerase elongation subunit (family B)